MLFEGPFDWLRHNILHTLPQRIHFSAFDARRFNGIVQIYGNFPRINLPMPRSEKLVRTADAYGDDGNAKFLRKVENTFFEIVHMAIASAPRLRKSDQADSRVEGSFREIGHSFEPRT